MCVLSGSLLLTPSGEVPIETLSEGDIISTNEGDRRVKGITIIESFDDQPDVPVCLYKSSVSEGVPSQDLWISRFHRFEYLGEMKCMDDFVSCKVKRFMSYATWMMKRERRHFVYYHVQVDVESYYVNGCLVEACGHRHPARCQNI